MLAVTSLYGALMALLMVVLSLRVLWASDSRRPGRQRALADCTVHAPIGVLLLVFLELQNASDQVLHVLGLMLLIGRILHAWSLAGSDPRPRRQRAGNALSLAMLGFAAVSLLILWAAQSS